MFRIAVCDSEVMYFEQIKKICESVPLPERDFAWEYYSDGESLMNHIKGIDILFLAYELPGISGFEIRDMVERHESDCLIIFETRHIEKITESFGSNVRGFLEKPLQRETILRVFAKVVNQIWDNTRVVISERDKPVIIYKKDIVSVEADGHYSDVRTENTSCFSERSIGEWQEILDLPMFYRMHRSQIINLSFVKNIRDYVVFQNGHKILIPKRKKKEVMDAYNQYMARWCQ